MIQLFTELQEKKNVRSNLSALRASLKEATEEQKAQAIEFVRGHEDLVLWIFTGRGCKDAEECSTSSGRPGSTECVAAALESIYPGTDTVRKKCISGSHEGLHAEEILSQLKDRLAELEG